MRRILGLLGANKKRFLLGIAVLTGAAALAGCSDLETELKLNEDLSGSRIMTVEISNSKLESEEGAPPERIETVILDSLPEQLDFNGLQTVDDSQRAVFTLDFTSIQDYQAKVQQLLDAGDVDIQADVMVEVGDSPFSTGIEVQENFSSSDLLMWLVPALQAAGIGESQSEDSFFSAGDTMVVYGGEEYSSWDSQIDVSDISRVGMDQVELTTTMQGEGKWRRNVVFTMSSWDYERGGQAAAEKYFAEQLPEGAELRSADSDGSGISWQVTLPELEPAELQEATNQLFLTDDAVFSFTEEPSQRFLGMVGSLRSYVDCSQVCADGSYDLPEKITVSGDWRLYDDYDGESGSEIEMYANGNAIEFLQAYPVASVAIGVDIGLSGASDIGIEYVVSDARALETGEWLQEFFVGSSSAEVIVTEEDGQKIYALEFSGANAAEVDALLSDYLPGSSYNFAVMSGTFFRKFFGDLSLDLRNVLGSSQVTEGVSVDVSTPFMASVEGEWPRVVNSDDPIIDVSFSGSGMPVSGMVTLGVIILLILGALVALFVYRERISEAVVRQREHQQAAALARQSEVSVQDQQQPDPVQYEAATTEVEFVPQQTLRMSPTGSDGAPTPQTADATAEASALPEQENLF